MSWNKHRTKLTDGAIEEDVVSDFIADSVWPVPCKGPPASCEMVRLLVDGSSTNAPYIATSGLVVDGLAVTLQELVNWLIETTGRVRVTLYRTPPFCRHHRAEFRLKGCGYSETERSLT